MKLIKILSLFGVVFASQVALADTKLSSGHGVTKAIYDFCTQVDPADAATFHAMSSQTLGEQASLDSDSGFKSSYDTAMGTLKKLPRATAMGECHVGASKWTGGSRGIDDLKGTPGQIKVDARPDKGKRD